MDQILVSVLSNRLKSICGQMGVTIEKSAHSPLLVEGRDFSLGLYAADGTLIEQTEYIPILGYATVPGVKAIVDAATSTTALPRLRRVELNGNKFPEEDPNIEKLSELLSARKEEKASEYPEVDEDDEDAWGVDELDELEEEDSEDEASEAEEDAEEEKIVKDAEAAETQPVNQVKDNEIDDLADALGKTALK